MRILKFLSPDPSSPSAMRVMGLTSLVIAGGLSFYGLYRGIDPEKLAWLVGVFVTSGFGGKAIQKKFEKAPPVPESDKPSS